MQIRLYLVPLRNPTVSLHLKLRAFALVVGVLPLTNKVRFFTNGLSNKEFPVLDRYCVLYCYKTGLAINPEMNVCHLRTDNA